MDQQIHEHPLIPRREFTQPLIVELFEQVDRLEKQYKEALAQGDARSAEVIALRIEQAKAQSASDSNLLSMQIEQSERARRGRKPAPGEEKRLEKSLAEIQKQSGKLMQERQRLLTKLANISAQPAPESSFDAVRVIDRELSELAYRRESVELVLSDISKWRKDREHQAKVKRARENEARRKGELLRKAKTVEALIGQVGEGWKSIRDAIKQIAALSNTLEGQPFVTRHDQAAVLTRLQSAFGAGCHLGPDHAKAAITLRVDEIAWPQR